MTQDAIREDMEAANANVKSIDVKGKSYVMVNERIKAFRYVFPLGTISTEILEDDGERVTVKAYVYDGGTLLATGHAFEVKAASYINKTSYVENCETSAVGRALGFLGFGCDDSLASAEEVKNAIEAQDTIKAEEKKAETLNAREVKAFRKWIAENGIDESKLCAGCKVESLEQLTLGKYRNILDNAEKAKEAWT